MIPAAYITEWMQFAPWKSSAQVEQDLLISRVLTEIFSDRFLSQELAFRGGTALHKLYLSPASRYSEDIDLVQINKGPIGPILDRIRQLLDPLFASKAVFAKTQISNKLTYRYHSELPPVQSMKLKIEINCREHFSVLGHVKVPFLISSSWHKSSCAITTYSLEELLGTKLRALYQRNKGRDLYDQYQALTKVPQLDKKEVIRCYKEYMLYANRTLPQADVYLQNIASKIKNPDFIGDVAALIRPEEDWQIEQAYKLLMEELLWML